MGSKINTRPDLQKLIIYIVLTIVTLAVFWQINKFEFINLDDPVYIKDNLGIRSGITLNSIMWALNTRHADLWNPLVWLSFMLDYQLYGFRAGGYHVTNLILHIFSSLLLFWLFCRMTGELWKSAFVAAFFALHPLHVESVVWVSERKDVLSAFFWMLTLCLYIRYTEKPFVRRYLMVLCSFILALMSKPMVVTLPLIMILLDYWPLSRCRIKAESKKQTIILRQLKEKMPFIILSIIVAIVTLQTPQDNLPHKIIPLGNRLANAPVAFVAYLGTTLWPKDLAIFYPFNTQIPVWQTVGSLLMIIVITTLVMMMKNKSPYLVSGWLWYVITITPVIGLIQISAYSMADHYHYLPSIGIATILAWSIPSLIPCKELRKKIVFPAGIFLTAMMALLSWNQCNYWENSIKLFSHALRVTKDNTMVHNILGFSLVENGKIKEAIAHYDEAIFIAPDHVYAYINRGNAYAKFGQYERAMDDYNMAIKLAPDFAQGYYYRGTAYGKLLGQYNLALDDLNKTIILKPDYVDAYNNRGIVYTRINMYEKAMDDFNKAVLLRPDYINAYENRAFIYLNQGDRVSGCRDAKKACELGSCAVLQAVGSQGLCN